MNATTIIICLIIGIPLGIQVYLWLKALPDLWHSYIVAREIKRSPLVVSETMYHRIKLSYIKVEIHEKGVVIKFTLAPSMGIALEDIEAIEIVNGSLVFRHHLLHIQYLFSELSHISLDSIHALQRVHRDHLNTLHQKTYRIHNFLLTFFTPGTLYRQNENNKVER